MEAVAGSALQTRFLELQKTAWQQAVELDVDRMLALDQTLQLQQADIQARGTALAGLALTATIDLSHIAGGLESICQRYRLPA